MAAGPMTIHPVTHALTTSEALWRALCHGTQGVKRLLTLHKILVARDAMPC